MKVAFRGLPVPKKANVISMEPPEGGSIKTHISTPGRHAPSWATNSQLCKAKLGVGRIPSTLPTKWGGRSNSCPSCRSSAISGPLSAPFRGGQRSSILYRALFSAVKTTISQYSRELGFCRLYSKMRQRPAASPQPLAGIITHSCNYYHNNIKH